ncbi:MAG TPA: septal ring lytic transglycosylase RlpA family protein [Noviherbaspirillum sp.]|nr:septal ring lytic transglycosylase RlpA family protein [Noviherbaspirillum sp.]
MDSTRSDCFTRGGLLAALALAAAPLLPATAADGKLEPKTGKASYYGPQFTGRPMADGTPFDPESNHAASRTLPLGTWVKVTNLENGRSEVVQIRDRGPYIDGRIIDLSPRTARNLDMIEQGVVQVEVVPLNEEERQFALTEAELTSGE